MLTDSKSQRVENVLGLLLFLGMLMTLYNVFIYAPTEKSMGDVQRIFYFHVPSAFIAFLGFLVCAGYSVAFLIKRNHRYDRVAYVSAEIGVLFSTIVLITGMIWARPIWQTWWTWDPRLTTMFILWFLYIAYLMLRNFTGEDERGARFAAVFAIIASADVPIVYMSIRWWGDRMMHPKPVLMGDEDSGLAPEMLYTFLFALAVFLILYFYLMMLRLRQERTAEILNSMKKNLALNEE